LKISELDKLRGKNFSFSFLLLGHQKVITGSMAKETGKEERI
jgi:hypothetical protein